MSAPILRGQLNACGGAKELNVTVNSYAPVLELSWLLFGACIDPATRSDILCVAVHSIGKAARLRVATHRVGFEGVAEQTVGLPVPQNANEVSPTPGVRSAS
jgi:hypothetical protein